MWKTRKTAVGLVLLASALILLFGCRAFEPEVVVVNKLPETYIVSAPIETAGGYFHFHVYWYGSDADGAVERFVWAITDTALQDWDTDEDEEDQLFNPAEDISTLEIGHWTTRTDSVFDFQIDEGPNLAKYTVLHMVAVDDRGDFDRTPARLHFISNAVANPEITFFQRFVDGSDTTDVPFADYDTIGYSKPFEIVWRGKTGNIRAYDPVLLAERDTVPPRDDGLYGFQWKIVGEAGDVWRPRDLDEATGDSFSYFAQINGLKFGNNDAIGNVFRRRLASGSLALFVNTIDVAGVEVPGIRQLVNVVINYDPETKIIVGRDLRSPDDDSEYPYYISRYGPNAGVEQHFNEGDTVPDAAFVVFKARGRDDPRDVRAVYGVDFQGTFKARQRYNGGNYFNFSPTYSALHQTPAWTADTDTGWSRDTLGFPVGPFDYRVIMRAVDEHGRRDGTPDTLDFVANFPPCVQCVELLNEMEMTAITRDDPCYIASCFTDTARRYCTSEDELPDRRYLTEEGNGDLWYNRVTREVRLVEPNNPEEFETIDAVYFTYRLTLSGREISEDERTADNTQRVMAWTYQVDYASDPVNQIPDGINAQGRGGIDRFGSFTEEFATTNPTIEPVYIDSQGVWYIRVRVAVPRILVSRGPADYFTYLVNNQYDGDEDAAREAWDLTTKQIGDGWITAMATDQASCTARSSRGKYYYFTGVRPPATGNPGRNCSPSGTERIEGELRLENFRAYSDTLVKYFHFTVQTGREGDFDGGPPPF